MSHGTYLHSKRDDDGRPRDLVSYLPRQDIQARKSDAVTLYMPRHELLQFGLQCNFPIVEMNEKGLYLNEILVPKEEARWIINPDGKSINVATACRWYEQYVFDQMYLGFLKEKDMKLHYHRRMKPLVSLLRWGLGEYRKRNSKNVSIHYLGNFVIPFYIPK